MKFLRLLTICFCLAVLLVPSVADAFGGPVTSNFEPGGRVHPTKGVTRPHHGTDIGIEEGTAVPSLVNGTVSVISYDPDGWGNYIIVNGDNGDSVLYGHGSGIPGGITVGSRVKAGQIVFVSGNTGASSGPHLHVEYHLGGYKNPVNALPFLLAGGWDLSGDLSGNTLMGAFSLQTVDLNELLNVPLGFDFEYVYSMGKFMREALEKFIDACISGLQKLIEISIPLLAVLAIIDLTMFIWRGPAITGTLESSFWTGIMQRIVKYGFLTFIISSWQIVVNKVFIGTAKWSFETFSSSTASVINDITAPDTMFQHFVSFLNPSMSYLSTVTVLDLVNHPGLFLLNLFVSYAGLILFAILIFTVILIYLEFYMSAVFSAFSLSFGGLKPTTFITEGMVSHLINSTLRLMSLGLVFAIMKETMELYEYSATDIFGILGALLFVLIVVVVGMLLPNRIADGLQVSAKL